MTEEKKELAPPEYDAPTPATPTAINPPPQQPWGTGNLLNLAGLLLTLAVVMAGLVVWFTGRTLNEHSAKMETRLLEMQHELSTQIKDSFQDLDKRISILRDVVQLIVFKTEGGASFSKSDTQYMKEKLKQVRLDIEPLLEKTIQRNSVPLDHAKLSKVREPITLRDDGSFLIRFYESTAPDFKPSEFDVHGDTCETKSFDLGIPGYSAKICHKHLVHDGMPRLEVVITRDFGHSEKKPFRQG